MIFCQEWGDSAMIFTRDFFTRDKNSVFSHEWKSSPNHLTRDKNSVFVITHTLFCFLHAILFPDRAHKRAKTIIDCPFRSFRQGRSFLTLIPDVKRTRDVVIVRTYSSIVFARANWHKGELHLWITTVNIDFPPPGIHSLACKKQDCTWLYLISPV